MSLIKEFKEFAIKGNAIDMAVGIIIGAAFGKIVSSLVEDIIMPPIGLLIGGIDFSQLEIPLKTSKNAAESVAIHYGAFLNTAINFFIIAGTIFLVVKGINTLRKKTEAEAKTKKCPECQMDIPLSAKRCRYCTTRL
jgi:large conductance mechanosensitive channel